MKRSTSLECRTYSSLRKQNKSWQSLAIPAPVNHVGGVRKINDLISFLKGHDPEDLESSVKHNGAGPPLLGMSRSTSLPLGCSTVLAGCF